MKKLVKYLPILLSALFLFSCEPEDTLIDNSSSSYKFLIATKDPSAVSLISYPSKEVTYNDIYESINGIKLSSGVTRMVEFYKYIFAFKSEEFKIDILDKSTYKILNTIDFSAEKKKPISICFPNITDSYIIFEKDSSVVLYDIINFKQARTIIVGKYPTSIAAYTNQIYVTNQLDNTVSVIDSRTHKVEQVINVPEAPTYVDFTPDGAKAVVVSLGGGKLDSTKAKTAAVVSFIDLATRLIVKSKNIAAGSISANNVIPVGFTITSKFIGVIPTKDYLFRIETRYGDVIALANRGNYTSVGYNFKSDELMMIKKDTKGTYLIVADPLSTSQRQIYTVSNNTTSILPL